MSKVQGKVALVTGAASGIGAACAEVLAREGARIVATDIDDARGDGLIAKIKQAGGEAKYFHHDVTSEAAWAEVVEATEKQHGRLDILVSNAGIALSAPSIVDVSLSDWRRQTAINLDGVFLSVKYSIPAMRRCGGGSIIVMSSVAGLRGAPSLAGYCATKGGVRLFAKAVAMECAQANDGIRVNSVHPGIIDTPIWDKITGTATPPGHNSTTIAEGFAQLSVPLGFAGQAEDVANGVLYLASDAARYLTGTELIIDGGMTGGSFRRAPPDGNQ
jgi:NAD(P)-dependent dehydrogenase (short-subunit alcohol dehydrogenase family)